MTIIESLCNIGYKIKLIIESIIYSPFLETTDFYVENNTIKILVFL